MLKDFIFFSFSPAPSFSTDPTASSTTTFSSSSTSDLQLPNALRSTKEDERRHRRSNLSPDRLLKAAAETLAACQLREAEEGKLHQASPPSLDFRFSTDSNHRSKLKESATFSGKSENDDYVSVGQVTLHMDVEAEKPKNSQNVDNRKTSTNNFEKKTTLNNFDRIRLTNNVDRTSSTKMSSTNNAFDESSTDPIYSDGSTLSFGETLILSDGLNNLDEQFVRELNSPSHRLNMLEPRPLVFNIPPVTSQESTFHEETTTSDDAASNDVLKLKVDTSTSVI